MKTITETELKSILDSHKLWYKTLTLPWPNRRRGNRADLRNVDFENANLQGASLVSAYLEGVHLAGANLKGANLYGANLWNANLVGANLQGANLRGANLVGTILEKKQEKVAEKPETVSASSNLRAELEAIAKKHGMRIGNLDQMQFFLI